MQIYLEYQQLEEPQLHHPRCVLSTFLMESEGNTALNAPAQVHVHMACIQMPKCMKSQASGVNDFNPNHSLTGTMRKDVLDQTKMM